MREQGKCSSIYGQAAQILNQPEFLSPRQSCFHTALEHIYVDEAEIQTTKKTAIACQIVLLGTPALFGTCNHTKYMLYLLNVVLNMQNMNKMRRPNR